MSLLTRTCPHYDMVPQGLLENLDFRKATLKKAGRNPGFARNIVKMCAEDPLFYINMFGWTYDPRPTMVKKFGRGDIPFITYKEFQDDAILQMCDAIDNGYDLPIMKSRDMGASWMGLTVIEWYWHFKNRMSFLLVSRTEAYVDERGNDKSLFWKIDFLHEKQPRWLLPRGRHLRYDDPNRKQLHLLNAETKSLISGESTTGDVGRGGRRTAMFIDEYAAFDVAAGFATLSATRDTTHCRIFNSTPQGTGNAFYEVCHNTAAVPLELHWSKHPEKNPGLYSTGDDGKPKVLDDFSGAVRVFEKGKKGFAEVKYPEQYPFILDGKMRSPWYDEQCSRCASDMEVAQELDIDFLGSSWQFFSRKFIKEYEREYVRPPMLTGEIEMVESTPKVFREGEKGRLKLWMQLKDELGGFGVNPEHRYVIGADVSAGVGASNSALSVVDSSTGEKVGVWHDPHTRPLEFAKIAIATAKFFNNAMLIWDASGAVGTSFTQAVIEDGYRRLYYRRSEKKVTKQISKEPGYFLNPDARAVLLEFYRSQLADHKFINRSASAMRECLEFIVQPGGKVEHQASRSTQDPTGAKTAHGDEVIADALACRAISDSNGLMQGSKPVILRETLMWRMESRKRKNQREMANANRELTGTGW